MIKQEQTERAERAKETWEAVKDEDDLQELEDQTKREEEWKSIQGKKVQSKEEAMAKVDRLKTYLNDDNKGREDDDLILWENQEWYYTLSDIEKEQFHILYDVNNIFNSYREDIKRYKKEYDAFFENPSAYTKSEEKIFYKKAERIASNLHRKLKNYQISNSIWIKNAHMNNLFKIFSDCYNRVKWVIWEYPDALKEMINEFESLNKGLENKNIFQKKTNFYENLQISS